MKVRKMSRWGLLLFLFFALTFILAACKAEEAIAPLSAESTTSLQRPDAAPSSDGQSQAEQASATTGETPAAKTEMASGGAAGSESTASAEETSTQAESPAPQESAPAENKETGPELNPNSQFALLEPEQQEELVEMMENMQSAYASLGEAFEKLGQHDSEILDALKNGKGISGLESFTTFKEEAATVLDQLAAFENQGQSELAKKLCQSSVAVSTWYKDFISQLETKDSSDLSDFRSWLESKRSEASDLIQGFLDTVQELYH